MGTSPLISIFRVVMVGIVFCPNYKELLSDFKANLEKKEFYSKII